jgi:hypothetical protein
VWELQTSRDPSLKRGRSMEWHFIRHRYTVQCVTPRDVSWAKWRAALHTTGGVIDSTTCVQHVYTR